ncbi:MAG: hypothetical protein QOK13_1432 [Gaiellaceae bacterium]|nr:hypothetical protein [Gaiellaceae bacterium]
MRIVFPHSVPPVSEAPRHPEVNQENTTALEPKNQILAAPIDLGDALTLQLGRHRDRLEGTHESRVVDLHVVEPPTDQYGLELSPDSLDLG